MTTCAHTHRCFKYVSETVPGTVVHSPGSIIHGSGNHPDKRYGKIMLRCNTVGPFILLRSLYTFMAHNVWIFTVQSCRLISAMKVYQEFPVSAGFCQSFIKINHPLITSLHKINLDAFNSP